MNYNQINQKQYETLRFVARNSNVHMQQIKEVWAVISLLAKDMLEEINGCLILTPKGVKAVATFYIQ